MITNGTPKVLASAIARGTFYFAFWVLLIGFKPSDLVVGLVAAGFATWTSLVLLPPGEFRLRLAGLPGYGLRFAWQSVVAGVDVARRAFAPGMPLDAGTLRYESGYPPGARRSAFASVTSLLPGTLALRDEQGDMHFHCLDINQPVAEQLATEESAMSRALPREPRP